MRVFIAAALLFFAQAAAQAQNSFVLDNKIIVELPEGYALAPTDKGNSKGGMNFTGPISNSELDAQLLVLGIDMSANAYFDLFIESMYSDPDDYPPKFLRKNFKSLNFNIIEIVPHALYSAESNLGQIPQSQMNGMRDFCDRFFNGFASQWGDFTFNVFEEQTEICHSVNLAGAVVSVSVKRVDNYVLSVNSLDFPLAMMTDVLGERVKNQIDIKNASSKEKMEYFGAGLNIEHARKTLISARLKLEDE